MSIIEKLDESLRRRQASYKMVTILAVLNNITENGEADLDRVVSSFKNFYLDRYDKGKVVEQKQAEMNKIKQMTDSSVKNTLLRNPVRYLSDFLNYNKENNQLEFNEDLREELKDEKTKKELKKIAYKHLYKYYEKNSDDWLIIDDLANLDYGYPVTANDIAALSGQNRVKGIHPIEGESYSGIAILCTVNGQNYPNEWLDNNNQILKYYLEGRTQGEAKKYNFNLKTNQAIIRSHYEKYPILTFVRESKNSYFYFEGEFIFKSIEQDNQENPYFILEKHSFKDEKDYKKEEKESEQPIVSDSDTQEAPEVDSLDEIKDQVISFINNKGFIFSAEMVKNYLLSLKCKPFVILAGISGTGKSKLVELVANSVGANRENGQFHLISVRPDWNDSTDLLGYTNLQGDFIEGELTKVIRRAEANKDLPYFVCLDEMNLARVEYYFSDILSVMEVREKEGDRIISAPMQVEGLDIKLTFPDNLYIIGTVNMDETTHSFSRKILDRANTIELNEVNLSKFPDEDSKENITPLKAHNKVFVTEYLTLKDCYPGNEEYIKSRVELLEQVNSILEKAGLQVGYRVRDEYCFYLVHNNNYKMLDENTAKDFQIMQKILPRIHGSSLEVGEVLEKMIELCEGNYPKSKNKAEFMLGRFQEDGFTSYWL